MYISAGACKLTV